MSIRWVNVRKVVERMKVDGRCIEFRIMKWNF